MNKWFGVTREYGPIAIDALIDHSGKNEPVFFNENSFHDLLSIERKRAERSKKPFMLLLIDIRALMEYHPNKSTTTRIVSAIEASSREIDLKGWYESKRVVGIIYTEISWGCKSLVIDKIKRKFTAEFSALQAESMEITAIFFPQNDRDPTDHETIERLYPELLASTVISKASLAAKRAIDIIGSVAGLLIFSPLFLIIAIALKTTSKGPVFFRQQRVGRGGKTFTLFKFRSMYADNDPAIHREFIKNLIRGPHQMSTHQADPGTTTMYKMVNDRRITPIGKILRKTSLDELPQFINVLLGDMSLVGPRPAIPYEVNEYDLWHLQRIFPVKPGITGMWQVKGRSTTTFDTMVRMDIDYIRNRSILKDILLICETPFAVMAAKGAV